MGEGDGKGVGGVWVGGFGEAEEGADHEGDLLFSGVAISDHGLLGLFGGVFEDAEAVGGGGDEGGGPGGAHGDGGAVGLDVDDALHGDFVGFPLFDEVAEGGANGGEGFRLTEFGGDGDGAVVEGLLGAGVAFHDGVAGVADGGVDGEYTHLGGG